MSAGNSQQLVYSFDREAFKLCREDVVKEFTENPAAFRDHDLVTIDYVRKSHANIYGSPYHKAIEMLMENAKLFLLAIGLDMKFRGQGHANMSEVLLWSLCTDFLKVQERMKGMMTKLGRKCLSAQECQQLLKQLIALGLVTEKPRTYLKKEKEAQTSSHITQVRDSQIFLKITIDDITNSVKNDPLTSGFVDSL
jgi:hypothetical protein